MISRMKFSRSVLTSDMRPASGLSSTQAKAGTVERELIAGLSKSRLASSALTFRLKAGPDGAIGSAGVAGSVRAPSAEGIASVASVISVNSMFVMTGAFPWELLSRSLGFGLTVHDVI